MGARRYLAAFTLLLGGISSAHATSLLSYPTFGSVVQGEASGVVCAQPNDPGCFYSLTQPPTSATGSASGSNGSASASADLASGTISASVSGNYYSQAHAVIWDTVYFSGTVANPTATLTISGTANVSGSAAANASVIIFDENLFPYGVGYFLLGNASTPEAGGAYTLSSTVGINYGDPYLVLAYVDAYAGLGGGPYPAGSASISDPLSLSVTDGVTITPDFALNSPVPEPATWAMLLLGFGGTGLMMRRARAKDAVLAV